MTRVNIGTDMKSFTIDKADVSLSISISKSLHVQKLSLGNKYYDNLHFRLKLLKRNYLTVQNVYASRNKQIVIFISRVVLRCPFIKHCTGLNRQTIPVLTPKQESREDLPLMNFENFRYITIFWFW